MKRSLFHALFGVGMVLAACAGQAKAQGFGGFPSPDEMFDRFDRDESGELEPEELEQIPWMRRMLEGSSLDPDEPVSRDDFIEMQGQMRERMRQGGFGRGGGGFGGGGPGNGGSGNGGFGGGGFGRGGFGGGRFGGGRGGDDENDEDGDDENRDAERRNRRGGRGPFGGPGGPATGGGQEEKSQGSSAGSNSAAESRPRLTMKLPDAYRSRDRDRDNQIGLYEWPRSDYKGFVRLDRNGDGFLTPQELSKGPRSGQPSLASAGGRNAPTVAASGRSGPAGGGPPAAGGEVAARGPAGDAPSAAAAGSGPASAAERAFGPMDRDKDGSLSEEEWSKGLLVPRMFKDAGIEVRFPLSRDEFVRLYTRARS